MGNKLSTNGGPIHRHQYIFAYQNGGRDMEMNDSVTGQERGLNWHNYLIWYKISPLPSPQVEYSTTVWPKQFKCQLALHGNTTDWYQVICSIHTNVTVFLYVE